MVTTQRLEEYFRDSTAMNVMQKAQKFKEDPSSLSPDEVREWREAALEIAESHPELIDR